MLRWLRGGTLISWRLFSYHLMEWQIEGKIKFNIRKNFHFIFALGFYSPHKLVSRERFSVLKTHVPSCS